MIKIVMWADGTWTEYDGFNYERDWAFMCDDYHVVEISEADYEKLLIS